MRHLSLFTGVGGGDLAHQHLLGWQTVGYVEFDKFCQQVLSQRIEDGFLQEAPIFGDVDGFIESGAVKKYKGYIDVVTAGFPCQPFSVAGKQAGEEDPRNKWPQTIKCIRDIRPRYALLENVPGLLASGYFPEILGSLAEAGMDARWIVLGADDVGAPHRRKRLWILADSESARLQTRGGDRVGTDHGSRRNKGQSEGACGETGDVADSNAGRIQPDKTLRAGGIASDDGSQFVADADSDDGWTGSGTVAQGRGSRLEHRSGSAGQLIGRSGEDVADSESKQRNGGGRKHHSGERSGQGGIGGASGSTQGSQRWWPTEPQLGRVAHGVANRVDRLKAIGNGQVSRVAAVAWRILNDPNR